MDKLDLVIDKIDANAKHAEHRLDRIDANLAEHMRRTDVLEKLHIDNQTRIIKLEETPNALKKIKSWSLYIAAIAGAVLTVLKLVEYI